MNTPSEEEKPMKYHHNRHFHYRREINEASSYQQPRTQNSYSNMSYGPYRPRPHSSYHPSAFIPRLNFQQHLPMAKPHPWACDYCKVATFSTYEEAYKHEQSCTMNQNRLSTTTTADSDQCKDENDSHINTSMLLVMPKDKDSLSDRQCYVRSDFVEIFTASEEDVAARHSKGAQKLYVGQIGIRCKHCTKLLSKNRAERAMCYPSSISRIYQTVADMQRFHFEACSAIPDEMKALYKSLKTTRPRGVGSPQAYWIASAQELGLFDTMQGIRFGKPIREERYYGSNSPSPQHSLSTESSRDSSPKPPMSPMSINNDTVASFPHLSPESLVPSSEESHMDCENERSDSRLPSRNSEANMLLALKNMHNPLDVKSPAKP